MKKATTSQWHNNNSDNSLNVRKTLISTVPVAATAYETAEKNEKKSKRWNLMKN